MDQSSAFLFVADVSERDMDFLLVEEFECNAAFRSWFLKRTGTSNEAHELVRLSRSVSTLHGETDLLAVFDDPNGARRALLIENKIAAPFTPKQADRYRRRGKEGIDKGEWTTFTTVLVAPCKRLVGVEEDAFDCQITYEECVQALNGTDVRSEFKRRMFLSACGKAKPSWIRKVDCALTAWFVEARRFAVAEFPDLPLAAEGHGRAPTNKWIVFYLKEFLQSRVLVEIKPHLGVVDLRFYGVLIGDLRRELSDLIPEEAETEGAKSAKSVSIRTRHISANVERPFSGQEDILRPMLASADGLRRMAQDHREKIVQLLGY